MALAPIVLASLLAGVYLVSEPPSSDLAAQIFRAELFADHGFAIWNNAWYGGHYLPGYSVVFPPLGALLGSRLTGAVAAVAAAGLFAALAGRRYGDRARLGAIWFGVATVTQLLTGRFTFTLGIAAGLGALLALQRGRPWLAVALAVLTALASPVAAAFLAIAGAAVALTSDRRAGCWVIVGAALPVIALGLAFPTDGYFPFDFGAFWPIALLAVGAVVLLPREEATLRAGAAIYGVASLAALLVHTPLGANMTRLGSLFAGPVVALAAAGRWRPLTLAALAVPLLWWQWAAPVRDLGDWSGDRSAEASYYEPLIAELDRRIDQPVRLEIPMTRFHGDALYVAPRFGLARGWLRQLDSEDFALFQDDRLTPASYREWLDERAVGYVALPDAPLDYLAEDEAELIRAGLPYLDEVWASDHWRLYRVRGAIPIAEPPSRLSALETESFTLDAPRAGSYLLRVRFSRYWRVEAGDACIARDGDWTRVQARSPGVVDVEARLTLDGLLNRTDRC